MTGTERKCFQKYYPADFDPSKIPSHSSKKQEIVQRVMVPFNMQCNSCSEYIYKGKKFNMNRETVEGETYLGLKLFKFYFNCPNCMSKISFRTDLENCYYQMEHGATRLDGGTEMGSESVDPEVNPMKMLENRQKQSLQELENLEELEDLQEKNRGKEDADFLKLLEEESMKKREMEEEEDEKMTKELLKSCSAGLLDPIITVPSRRNSEVPETNPKAAKRKNEQKERFAGIKLIKKSAEATSISSGLGLIADYESDSDSE